MPDNAHRQEYVLSEFGVLFVGSTNRISQVGWNYGQVKRKDTSFSCKFTRDPGILS